MESLIEVKNPKLKRTLERFKAKIEEGDFYEAHQTLRTIANRNVRSKAYGDAIDLLYNAAQILLKTSQPATGSDLTTYLVEVYVESETKVDTESRAKLIQLVTLFDSAEPTLKHVSMEIINWSIKFGEFPFGDPELHHALGSKFMENPVLAYEAEKHLILGTNASVSLYIKHIWEWYLEDPEASNVGIYCSRVVINYLLVSNVKAATEALTTLIRNTTAERPQFTHSSLTEAEYTITVFDGLTLLNLIQLLLVTVYKADRALFKKLSARYSNTIATAGLQDAFSVIGELYFGIVVPKQGNMLQDLMGALMGGSS